MSVLRRLFEGEQYGSSLIAFGVGLALTTAGFVASWRYDAARERASFERRARELELPVRQAFEVPIVALRSLPPLMAEDPPLDRRTFTAWASNLVGEHPGILSLQWAPQVADDGRASTEERARADGITAFLFTEQAPSGATVTALPRDEYVPVLYVAPVDAKRLGFDLLSDPTTRDEVLRARDSGSLVTSRRIELVQGEGFGVALYQPVYGGVTPPTVPARREAFRGVAVQVLSVKRLLERALPELEGSGFELALADPTAAEGERVLYDSVFGADAPDAEMASWSTALQIGDRSWRLSVARGPLYQPRISPIRWMVALAGLLVTLVATLGLAVARALVIVRRVRRETRKLGDYEILEQLHKGEAGGVYRARHATLRRPTALKLLTDVTPAHKARFEKEVALTSNLKHPNSIALYDYGRTTDGSFYFAMELVSGINLERLVEAAGPLPSRRVAHLLRQMLAALREAHQRDIVHRDVKPNNVMVGFLGGEPDFVKVLDFGLVRDLREDESAKRLTGKGELIGTPAYIAPEQIEGLAFPASDIYSVGAVAYFLLTGTEVFAGKTGLAMRIAHLSEMPQPPSERLGAPVHAGLEAVVLRALGKKPEDRYASASEMIAALQSLDVERWTDDEARAWWEQYEATHPPTSKPMPSDLDRVTISPIDLGERFR